MKILNIVDDAIQKTQIEKIYEKLQSPKRGRGSTTSLRFPEDVDTSGTQNIIRFKIALPEGSKYLQGSGSSTGVYAATGETTRYRNPQARGSIARRMSKNYKMTSTYIDLYMPHDLKTSYQTNWKNTELGATGRYIDAAAGLWNSDAKFSDMIDYLSENISTNMTRIGAGVLQTLTPLNVKDAVEIYTSTSENPYMEVMFEGVQNRTFNFSFKFIPKNAREQQVVKNIIDEFKFHRAPEFKDDVYNTYMLFPSEFDIQFIHKGKENNKLFRISTCALTSVDVDYSPEGQYASHEDGSPFATVLNLTFTELEALGKERHAQGY